MAFNIGTNNLESYLVPLDYFVSGGLWGSGRNNNGQLGNGATSLSQPVFVQPVTGGTNWRYISPSKANIGSTAGIKTDGTLWLWGRNDYGQLGDNTSVAKSSPVQTISNGNNWNLVSFGQYHTAAIKTDGSLWLWGNNKYGQLGNNSGGTGVNSSSPVQTVAGGNNWIKVDCGWGFTMAIKTDGTLWGWGKNTSGQLGNNASANKSSPVQTVAAGTNWKLISCGRYQSSAIKTDGTLWSWGQNNTGQLGDNTTTNRSSPVQEITASTNWKLVSCSSYAFTAALKTDGTLWLWGSNAYGQIGNNTSGQQYSSPVQEVTGGTNWRTVSTGGGHVSAIKTDGTLWTWGINSFGQLANNTFNRTSSPAQTAAGGTNWRLSNSGGYQTHAINLTWGSIT